MKALLYTRLVKLHVGNYVFNPGVFASLITIALLYIMLSMAQWQSSKAAYKDNLRDTIIARKELPAIGLTELPAKADDQLFLPLHIRGQFDARHYFLLDNKTLNNQVGYDVYAVFKIPGYAPMLINRGFVPQGRTRQDLPEIAFPRGTVELKGLLDRVPAKGFVLMDNPVKVDHWPLVLQYIDPTEIQGFLGTAIFDMILRLDSQSPYSYTSELPALNLDSAKNSGYAFQWYAMSVALTFIYFFVNTKRSKI